MKNGNKLFRASAALMAAILTVSSSFTAYGAEDAEIVEDVVNPDVEFMYDENVPESAPQIEEAIDPSADASPMFDETSDDVAPDEISLESAESYESFDDGYGRGYLDVPIEFEQVDLDRADEISPDMSGINAHGIRNLKASETLPAYYVTDTLPEIRNQNPYNNCWAYSSMAMAEINLMKNGKAKDDVNLSELQLSYYTYNFVTDPLGGTAGDVNASKSTNGPLNVGGNVIFSTNVLSNWIGAADADGANGRYENSFAGISAGQLDSGTAPAPEYAYGHDSAHLTGYYMAKYDLKDLAPIKKLIRDYGAVSMSMTSKNTDSYYNATNNSFYYFGSAANDHAITIVGWDDEFAADKFNKKPAGDGAWLVRNSWGGNGTDDYCKAGYFWMSYYDKGVVATNGVYAMEFDTADNYGHNYQYDGGMYVASSKRQKAANVFTVHANDGGREEIDAVSFATLGANADYEISVYTGLTDDADPESGSLADTLIGTTDYAGYYTVELNAPIGVDYGEKFSVVVSLSCTEGLAAETKASSSTGWYDIEVNKEEGQSFGYYASKSSAGYENWVDWSKTSYDYSGNFKIKAFTNNVVSSADLDVNAGSDEVTIDREWIKTEAGQPYGEELPVPVREGYTFLGWNTAADGSGDVITSQTIVSTDSNHTLYATWRINEYEIRFETNGGSSVSSQMVPYRGKVTRPADPVKGQAGFGGWYSDEIFSTAYDFDSMIGARGFTLYARWGVSVTLDANGGQLPDSVTGSIIVYQGDEYGSLPTPVREGYVFVGWFDENDELVLESDVVTNDHPYMLRAEWVDFKNAEAVAQGTAATGVQLSRTAITMAVGETAYITASVMPATASQSIEWRLSNEAHADYIVEGRSLSVTAKDPGSLVLTARSGTKQATCKITILAAVSSEGDESAPYVSSKTGCVAVGRTLTMTATYGTARLASSALEWTVESADGEGEANVSAKGVLTGLAEGRVNVYATNPASGTKSEACSVDVYVPVKKAELSVKSITIPSSMSEGYQLGVIVTPSVTGADHATGSGVGIDAAQEVKWELKDPMTDSTYVTISDTGIVTPKQATVKAVPVTATFRPYGATKDTVLTCNVTVSDKPLGKLALSAKKMVVDEGGNVEFRITTVPMLTGTGSIKCELDDDPDEDLTNDVISAAYDDSTGICRVTGIKPGTSVMTITATSEGVTKTAKCTVTVGYAPKEVVINAGSEKMLAIGKSASLKATVKNVLGKKYRNQAVTWESDDLSVAYVTPAGKVVAVGSGTANITARSAADPDVKASIKVRAYAAVTSFKADKNKTVIGTGTDNLAAYDAFVPIILPVAAGAEAVKMQVTASGAGGVELTTMPADKLSSISSSYAKKIALSRLDDYQAPVAGMSVETGEALCVRGNRAGTVRLTITLTDVAGKTKKTNLTVKVQ